MNSLELTIPLVINSTRKVIRMDSTQIVQLLKCPQLHNFVSVEWLTRKFEQKKYMDRGTVMHGLLERFYYSIWQGDLKNAAPYAISCLTKIKEQVVLDPEDYAILTCRFLEYTFKYSNDRIAVFTGSDGKPAIEIGFSVVLLDNDEYLFVLEGRIDLITLMGNRLVIWDHKFQGREYILYGKSVQALNYRLALYLQGVPANMFMYNYIRGHKKCQPNTFDRRSDTVSDRVLNRWHQKLIKIYTRRANGIDFSDAFPNQSCTDVGFGKKCPFTEICEEQSPGVAKLLLERGFIKRTEWLPWNIDDPETHGDD